MGVVRQQQAGIIRRSGQTGISTGLLRRAVPPRVRALSALLLVAVLVLTNLFLTTAAPPANAVDDQFPVRIDLEAVDPATPGRDSIVTLTGTATNTSTEPLTAVQAVFWRHQGALTTHAALLDAVDSSAGAMTGSQLWITDGYQRLTNAQHPALSPGESIKFSISASIESLGLSSAAGAFVIGIDIVGREGRASNTTLGRARVFIPLPRVADPAPPAPTPVVTVVVLSSRPSMVRWGLLSDDHLAAELGPNGRLTTLLRAGKREDVSYLVDPALIDELTMMAEGPYRVQPPHGVEFDGTGSALAAAWLDEFRALPPERGYRTSFGLPDYAALTHHGLAEVVEQSRLAGERVTEIQHLPTVAYTAGGAVDDESLELMETGEPLALFASTATATESFLAPVHQTPLVSYSANAFAGPGPEPRVTLVQSQQRLLSETYLDALSGRTTPRVRVITEGVEAQADLVTQPVWQERLSLTTLMAGTPADWSMELAYPDSLEAEEWGVETDRLIQLFQANSAVLTDLVVNPEFLDAPTGAALTRATSSWWRGDPQAQRTYLADLTGLQRRVLEGGGVRLNAQRSVIMSGQSGSFPVSVTNDLDQAVRVNIVFASDQPQRLSIDTQSDLVVPPHETLTVNIQPDAVGNGPVRVVAHLSTSDGTQIGRRAFITVEATNLGFVGWIIVIASGAVLLSATAFRIRQVRREKLAASQVGTLKASGADA